MINTKLRLITGLHIGGSDDTMAIGGIDSSVIKREVFVNEDGSINYDGSGKKIIEPYIPGSSLKGKIRSLLEHAFGLIREQKRIYENHKDIKKQKKVGSVIDSEFIEDCKDCDELTKKKAVLIVTLFGESAGGKGIKNRLKITRAIFRDSFLTKDSRRLFLEDKIKLSEEKAENSINRVKVTANPRFLERVPAGVEFDFEVVLRKFKEDEKLPLKETMELGLLLLQNDTLGGGGSRGNGKIKFEIFENVKDEELELKITEKMREIEEKLEKWNF